MSSVHPARVVLLRLVVLATILALVLPARGAAAVSADEKIGSNEVSVHPIKTAVNTVEPSPISVGPPTRPSECPTDQTDAIPVEPQEAPEQGHHVKYPRLHGRFSPLKVQLRPRTRQQRPVETSRPDWGRAAPDFRIRLRSRQKIRRHNLLSSSQQLRQRPTTETAHLRKDTATTMIPVIPVLLAATPVTAPATERAAAAPAAGRAAVATKAGATASAGVPVAQVARMAKAGAAAAPEERPLHQGHPRSQRARPPARALTPSQRAVAKHSLFSSQRLTSLQPARQRARCRLSHKFSRAPVSAKHSPHSLASASSCSAAE